MSAHITSLTRSPVRKLFGTYKQTHTLVAFEIYRPFVVRCFSTASSIRCHTAAKSFDFYSSSNCRCLIVDTIRLIRSAPYHVTRLPYSRPFDRQFCSGQLRHHCCCRTLWRSHIFYATPTGMMSRLRLTACARFASSRAVV